MKSNKLTGEFGEHCFQGVGLILVCALEPVGLWNLGWDPGKADAGGLGAKVESQHSQAALLSGSSALIGRIVLCDGGP